MHQIGVVGLSYRHVGVDEVARFSVPKTEVVARLPALRDALGVSEVFYVGTCNRVEILFSMPDGAPAGDARSEVFRALIGREPIGGEATRLLRAWTGEAAVEHLFLVACGLDSAQAGEQEIAAQIRLAWETAREARVCGPTLDKLLREALSMAHRVHKLEANVRTPSLADLAADRIIRHFNGKPATVALVGVSPMTKRCGMILHRAGIPLLVVNRTLQSAEEYAATVGGQAVQLDEFRTAPAEVGALVLAAGGSEPVLDGKSLPKIAAAAGSRAPLLLDFGVPPNADPDATRAAGIARVGMDDLIQAAQARRLSQLMRLAPVRAAIDERLNRLRSDLATRAIGRRLADLRGTFEQIAAEEAERALSEEFSNLDPTQRELLQKFASIVARRLAHLPLAGMRAAAAHASTDAVDAFFREAKLRRSANGEATGRWRTDLDAVEVNGLRSQLHAEDNVDANGSQSQLRTDDTDDALGSESQLRADHTADPAGSQSHVRTANAVHAAVSQSQLRADPAITAAGVGQGWKPDADSNEWTAGRQRRFGDDAADVIGQRAMLGGNGSETGRRPVKTGGRRAPDTADPIAEPVRTGWAKD